MPKVIAEATRVEFFELVCAGVAMKAAAGNGMAIAAHPRAVADSAETVISIITEDGGVRNIFRGTDGFLSGDVRGKLFIEMSTVRPETEVALARPVAAAGR